MITGNVEADTGIAMMFGLIFVIGMLGFLSKSLLPIISNHVVRKQLKQD